MWREGLKKLLEPYSPPVETKEGIYTELVDEEGEVYDRLAFYVENPEEEWALVKALVEAIEDLTDHDIPGRNVFAFGFKPDFNGTVIKLSFFDAEPGKGAAIGKVPERILEIAERNAIPVSRAEEEGIPILGRIPYDRAIPESMSMLKPVVEAFPESKASKAIEKIAETIKKELLG
jgi:type III secretion system FlhB-like substrate exporter